MTNKSLTAEKLLQAEAVVLRPENPFTWASGWKSPIYCDNRKLLSLPFTRDFVKSELANLVFEKYPAAEVIAGVATAGIAWGALVADQLKLPFLYVRPKPKEHGRQNQIEGSYEAKQKIVVVEDLVSTGKSSLQTVDVLRREELDVIGMIAIFSYAFAESEEAFRSAEVDFLALTDYTALVQLATEKQVITSDHEAALLKWRTDPAAWTGTV